MHDNNALKADHTEQSVRFTRYRISFGVYMFGVRLQFASFCPLRCALVLFGAIGPIGSSDSQTQLEIFKILIIFFSLVHSSNKIIEWQFNFHRTFLKVVNGLSNCGIELNFILKPLQVLRINFPDFSNCISVKSNILVEVWFWFGHFYPKNMKNVPEIRERLIRYQRRSQDFILVLDFLFIFRWFLMRNDFRACPRFFFLFFWQNFADFQKCHF